ncbi:MAG TPA: hypothetical protein VF956_01480 [Candidatus Dormibacteraeota bacterium]
MRAPGALLLAAFLALAPVSISAAGPSWAQWQPIPGVFDLGGPRSDGSLVVAGSANLYLADPAGNVTPFARGPGGYREDAGAEAYMTVSPRAHVVGANCDFVPDETFLLRLHVPLGIERVDAPGENTGSFANISGVTSLNGIVFDTTGFFDHRLLVSGPANGKSVIAAIDCNGTVQVITRSAPVLEGGLAVAPLGFGAFGGALIAPDELSGNIYAITADGSVSTVATPLLPTGADIGVESLGFVPPGFMRGGEVYYADRLTQGNPHPGTDHVLRLLSADLATAGVQDGDLLVTTEGGATMVAVRCGAACIVIPVVTAATTAHGEGHVVFTIDKTAPGPTPSPTARPSPQPSAAAVPRSNLIIAIIVAVALLAFVVGFTVARRRK